MGDFFSFRRPCALHAVDTTQAFPPAHDLFAPLQADPTEAHFAVEAGLPVSQRAIARADVGEYIGLYRWLLPHDWGSAQINVGGAIFSRFDATPDHSLQVIDYYGNVPLDIKLHKTSLRLMFYHDSSHLGDDYLREKGIVSQDHSWEAVRGIMSYQPCVPLRLYAGYTDAYHRKPAWEGPQALQAGMEIYFNPNAGGRAHPYWATDIQSWHRNAWNPTYTSQFGIKTVGGGSRGRGIAYFVEYMAGPRLERQFFQSHESIWLLGVKFDLSPRPILPSVP